MTRKNLNFDAEGADVTPNSQRLVSVSISGASVDDILNEFNATEITDHFDSDELLKNIGSTECKDYYDLVDRSDLDTANESVRDLEQQLEDAKDEVLSLKMKLQQYE